MKRKKELPQRVFYCRLSTVKRKEESGELDFENQIQMLRKKWGDLPVHQEVVSGAGKRRVLMNLVATLPKGSTIHAVHVDRLSRKGIFDLLWIMNECREKGITIETLEDGVLDGQQEIMLALRAYAAEQERLAAQRRVKAQMKACKEQNRHWGVYRAIENGTWRYGIKDAKPAYVNGVPRLVALHLEGHSYADIARIFNEETGAELSTTHCWRIVQKALNPPEPKPYPKLPRLTHSEEFSPANVP